MRFLILLRILYRLQSLKYRVGRLTRIPPSTKPAIVVAPHPDDEIFGVGGTIAIKKDFGANVKIVYLTNGENVYGGKHGLAREDIAQARQNLARQATRCVGVPPEDLVFLGYPDGRIPRTVSPDYEGAVSAIERIIVDAGASEVYAPHPFDYTEDHVAASKIVQEAVKRVKQHCSLNFYCVWMWYRGQLAKAMARDGRQAFCVDLEGARRRKKEAMRIYVDSRAPSGEPWSGYLSAPFLMGQGMKREMLFDGTIHAQEAL